MVAVARYSPRHASHLLIETAACRESSGGDTPVWSRVLLCDQLIGWNQSCVFTVLFGVRRHREERQRGWSWKQ